MKIIDINGNERDIISIKKIKHQVPDAVSGDLISLDYIEVKIKGNHRPDWIEWYPLKDFEDKNPNKIITDKGIFIKQ